MRRRGARDERGAPLAGGDDDERCDAGGCVGGRGNVSGPGRSSVKDAGSPSAKGGGRSSSRGGGSGVANAGAGTGVPTPRWVNACRARTAGGGSDSRSPSGGGTVIGGGR